MTSVFDGTRTWNYAYNGTTWTSSLATVTLPDGSAGKQMGAMAALLVNLNYNGEGNCEDLGAIITAGATVRSVGFNYSDPAPTG